MYLRTTTRRHNQPAARHIDISDWRLVKEAQLLQLLAVSDGQTTVDPVPDFLVLEHCLWMDDPTDRIQIRDWIWDHVTPLDNSSSLVEGTSTTTTTTTPHQLRFLLHTVQQEILETLQRTDGALDLSMDTNDTETTTDGRPTTSTSGTVTNGSDAVLVHPEDIPTLEDLRKELERITLLAQQNLQRLIRHQELVRQLSPVALASSSATTTNGSRGSQNRATDITAESGIAGTDDHTNRTRCGGTEYGGLLGTKQTPKDTECLPYRNNWTDVAQ